MYEIADACLDSNRQNRRKIAYRLLRELPIDSQCARRLLRRYRTTADKKLLQLIARNRLKLGSRELRVLIARLDDDYWRARAIESVIATNQCELDYVAQHYPKSFIWAVGRSRDGSLLHLVRDTAQRLKSDPEIISIYVWCAGILGSSIDLRTANRLVREFDERRLRDRLDALLRPGGEKDLLGDARLPVLQSPPSC
ncbi:MAG: hypothetical protein QM770_14665 [Tepidisphaeraceae bacterium]